MDAFAALPQTEGVVGVNGGEEWGAREGAIELGSESAIRDLPDSYNLGLLRLVIQLAELNARILCRVCGALASI